MIPILYEDNHLLALDKPAGLLSQGDDSGDASVVDIAKDDLKRRYAKPGNVYVGLLHRLDRPVSGVILLAKTSKAAARLSAQFHEHSIEKTYLALVNGSPTEMSGEWVDYLVKDERANTVRTVKDESQGVRANLAFRVLETDHGFSLLEIRPTTGRGHQLRVQLSSRGLPIVGDRKYGAGQALRALDGRGRIALHARELVFQHPTLDRRISVVSELPADWPGSGARFRTR